MKGAISVVTSGLALAVLFSAPALADKVTYVSGLGSDSNACSISAPCETLAHAINQTSGGGTIVVLGSGSYKPVTITKAINIVNDGVGTASIFVPPAGVGITVNTSGAVTLRGLTIEGSNSGATGISFVGTGTLNVLDCTVRGMTGKGISITPGSGGFVTIADSTINNNASDGVYATGDGSGTLTLALTRDKIINNRSGGNGYGFRMTGGGAAFGYATIDSSLIAENGTGVSVTQSGSNAISTFLINSQVVGNLTSINIGTGAFLKLEKTAVANYIGGSGGIVNSGSIVSFGDNAITDTVTGTAISGTALK